MLYKGYKLTNFSCAAADLKYVQAAYHDAIDLALGDEHFDKLGVGFIEDMFFLKAVSLLYPSPVNKDKPFSIERIKEDETN